MNYINRMIANHVVDVVRLNRLNSFITVPFSTPSGWRGQRFRLTQHDIAHGRKMFWTYILVLENKLWGKSRTSSRHDKKRISVIGIPEWLDKFGEECPLHYHAAMHIPEELYDQAVRISRKYWSDIGMKYYSCPIEFDLRPAWNHAGAVEYSIKHCDDERTIQNMIVSGLTVLN